MRQDSFSGWNGARKLLWKEPTKEEHLKKITEAARMDETTNGHNQKKKKRRKKKKRESSVRRNAVRQHIREKRIQVAPLEGSN